MPFAIVFCREQKKMHATNCGRDVNVWNRAKPSNIPCIMSILQRFDIGRRPIANDRKLCWDTTVTQCAVRLEYGFNTLFNRDAANIGQLYVTGGLFRTDSVIRRHD